MKGIILGFFLFTSLFYGQAPYPTDFFRSPLDIPIILSGTFGELRSNHFHSGIDIKTQQRQGLPVYSIGDGAITRIKVSEWGYGKALYIAHPNGYTSVYGHLQKFSPDIEAYVKKIQYQKKSFEVEIFPDFSELKPQKGELIAYTGNTGGSAGPHLHFEIRSSASEMPTNPLLHGLDVRDATDPTLLSVYAYPLSENAQVNQSQEKIKLKYHRQSDGTFLADKVTALGTIGFGINTFDRQDLAANQNGVYSVKQVVNGKLYTDYDFETFSFTESRYINTLIDYDHFSTNRERIQKCFKDDSNLLGIYRTIYNNGKIEVSEGLSYNVEILINDLAGNLTKLIIPVEGKQQDIKIPKKEEKTDNYIIAKKPNNFDLGGAKVYFPANTFYNNFYIDLKNGQDTVTIHNSRVPAHRNFTITFDVSKYSDEERKQLFIGRLDNNNSASYASTYKRGTTFTTRTRNLGTYTLAKDTVAPQIRPKNFKDKQWLTNYSYLSLSITDNLSGINTYNATLNGEWILLEYEPKTNTITYNFDDLILDKKQCELKVVVTDNVGNSSTFTSTFYRK
ncbi:M23 family metallopeptidase [Arenibacter sp. BSSL-BM3]|uniref:M23 family metallopeptidase n=1 Tax=Arenibacter arenosicollis TaxID=2762274 RepID=A0ABR7QMB1_9FLAO|nr:M23 family metallopeptidase [Arenibacter arenosicollis]MBC8768060.1 M23 family metallopeptidase [Arenibacter arenosicollis]